MAKLGDQVLLLDRKSKFDAHLLMQGLMKPKPVKNTKWWNKPKGGLWTSTLVGSSSAWLDFCAQEFSSMLGKQAVILTPTTTKILHILTPEDFEAVYRKYPLEIDSDFKMNVDWEAVAKDYDAAHVDPSANWSELREWSTESTVWFKPGLRFKALVDVKNRCQLAIASRLAMAARLASAWDTR